MIEVVILLEEEEEREEKVRSGVVTLASGDGLGSSRVCASHPYLHTVLGLPTQGDIIHQSPSHLISFSHQIPFDSSKKRFKISVIDGL